MELELELELELEEMERPMEEEEEKDRLEKVSLCLDEVALLERIQMVASEVVQKHSKSLESRGIKTSGSSAVEKIRLCR